MHAHINVESPCGYGWATLTGPPSPHWAALHLPSLDRPTSPLTGPPYISPHWTALHFPSLDRPPSPLTGPPYISTHWTALHLHSLDRPHDSAVDPDEVLALVLVEQPLVPSEEILLPIKRLTQQNKTLSKHAMGEQRQRGVAGVGKVWGQDALEARYWGTTKKVSAPYGTWPAVIKTTRLLNIINELVDI